MKLYEMAELLKGIESRINHKCRVNARVVEAGLQLDIYFTRSTDRKSFELHQIFAWPAILDTHTDAAMIKNFVQAVNHQIKIYYQDAAQSHKEPHK